MGPEVLVAAFMDEMEKISARIRVMHGTNFPYKVLKPRASTGKGSVLSADPNPSAVYMATKKRSARKGVESFAQGAAARHGGTPHVGYAKVDTKKGWRPHQLTRWAREEGWTKKDMEDLVGDLDAPGRLKGAERGEVWEILNRAVGAWAPSRPDATVRVRKWKAL